MPPGQTRAFPLILLLCYLTIPRDLWSQAGSVDSSFVPAAIPDTIYSLLELPDGRVLAGVRSERYGAGFPEVSFLRRLNADGSHDPTFPPFPGVAPNDFGRVTLLAATSDSKVLAGGQFVIGTNTDRGTLVRLLPNGTLDPGFSPVSFRGLVAAMTLLNDDRILVGGTFTAVNGQAKTNLVRLQTNGAIDGAFTCARLAEQTFLEVTIRSIAVQPDGKLVIAGQFSTVDGIEHQNIARLNGDGSRDPTFASSFMGGSGGLIPGAYRAVLDGDGKTVVGGQFGSINGVLHNHLVRFNTNGTVDATFQSSLGQDGHVGVVIIQADRKLFVGGSFSSAGGQPRYRVARLQPGGSLDPAFDTGVIDYQNFGAGVIIAAVAAGDGKWLFAGQFDTVNQIPRLSIARVFGDANPGPGNIQFTATTVAAAEDGSLDALLSGARTDGRTGEISVTYSTAPATALAGLDYQSTTGVVTFTNGEFTPKQISVPVIDDPWEETAEHFTVTLANPSGGGIAGTGSATVMIVSNDYSGSVDTGFAPGTATRSQPNCQPGCFEYSYVAAIAPSPDGSLVLGGYFLPGDGTNFNHITRLLSDGSLDPTFQAGASFNGPIQALALQADGKILVGGEFTAYHQTAARRLTRLQTNGIRDTSFNIGSGFENDVLAIQVEPDGRILVGGRFSFLNGTLRTGIARLETNGGLNNFTVSLRADNDTAEVRALALTAEGSIYSGGFFQTANGQVRNGIVRLLSNGAVDTAFVPPTGTNGFDEHRDYTFYVHSLLPLPDGKVLVGGEFNTVAGLERNGLVRLNANGFIDTNFVPPFKGYCYVLSMVPAAQGKIYVAGVFSFDGDYFIDGVLRLNDDGSVDETFAAAVADGSLYVLALSSNGQPVVGGNFNQISGTPRYNLARLNGETRPLLRLEPIDAASVRLSWPSGLRDLIVESAAPALNPVWAEVTPAPVLSNGRFTVTNTVVAPGRLYRPRNTVP